MRIVAWNANFNNQRRSLEQDIKLLSAFRADVLVISETSRPSVDDVDQAHWIGFEPPGLAIVARDGLSLEPHPANALSPSLMAGFRVSGRVSFNLLAVWPVQHKGGPSYAQILQAALDQYRDLLVYPVVMAGDFNSSTKVTGQRNSHPRFVTAASELGLISAYHHLSGEEHGEESRHTYRHDGRRSFHIDYCFLSRELAEAANFGIAHGGKWTGLSDHSPVILDVPDAALRAL